MKKLSILIVLLSVSVLNAAIITVDNKVPSAGNYATLQAAHDAASNGDIIYVFPSLVPYNAITVTKQLTFYGVGFDITENIGEPFTPTAIISGSMKFDPNSDGSQLVGFDGGFEIRINAPNILIKRNRLGLIIIDYLGNGNGSGSVILQNKIISSVTGGWGAITVLYRNTGLSNILIANNILINLQSFGWAIHKGNNFIIYNNVMKTAGNTSIEEVNNSLFVNNIFLNGTISGAQNQYSYNMCNSSQLPVSNGNQINIDMSTVFIDYENYNFHLLPESPAKSTGENGTDMGIYGGDAPYVDGGFPGLSSILQIQAPIIGSQQSGLDINFKAKSNKE